MAPKDRRSRPAPTEGGARPFAERHSWVWSSPPGQRGTEQTCVKCALVKRNSGYLVGNLVLHLAPPCKPPMVLGATSPYEPAQEWPAPTPAAPGKDD